MPRADSSYKPPTFDPDPLDLAILTALPNEGATLGRYLADGLSVKAMPNKIDPTITSSTYSGRVRSMVFHGLAVEVKGAKQGERVYQRTAKGAAYVTTPLRDVSAT